MALPNIPVGIETQANAAFNEVRAAVDAYQPTYLATHGIYWQGINSSTIPVNGAAVAMDLTRHPTDQVQDWSWFTPSGSYPISFEVHTYDGPQGKGYTMIGHISIGGNEYVRVNDGAWTQVIVEGF